MPVRALQFILWPALAGLFIALTIFIAFPRLMPWQLPVAANKHANPSQVTSYADAVDQAANSVVNIYSRKIIGTKQHPLAEHPLFEHLYRNPEQQKRVQSALGSGVIVSEEGYLLTNNHVIDGADEILVLLHDGRRAGATFIGNDPESDLAVLKIELDNLTPIQIGNPAQTRVGDVVLAIGNPFGVGQTVTQGIVSALRRYGLGISTYENYIQTDAAINPGNSGGALIDTQGNLLGINAAIIFDTVGIGFAVPADDAIDSLSDIVKYGRVVRGWLGLTVERLTPAMVLELNLGSVAGVLVTDTPVNDPAYDAGIRPGDVLTHIDGQPIGTERQGLNEVAGLDPGTKVTVQVLRPRPDRTPEKLVFEVTVEERRLTSEVRT
ncbi:trypsin-like peptidase domain-containing protein [Gilvimarinus sp. SDUM040013]|uniref:Trypsin-like peptidase domain-containing protein n=1 Tax=Gilvimarinus gilvus TaxID=3058038 RepID=A0ABU4RSM1_9GAMM|nr:trypsin-like peptidase domain-containing protein [Gilvimarinus sp. SDUM040013]MDO3388337.1 trypsin-like peptidase domain-containing protein [Gilvimarinus sp. SDUM040013]MDX6847887.1 trypsin-like peptidase domain-containing protein [Gilvimarinus sp. SDUM040013]